MFAYFNSYPYREKRNSDQKGKNAFLFIDCLHFSFAVSCVASVCNRVRDKKIQGRREGEKRFPSLPSPSPSFLFFALVTTFSTNSRGNTCYAGFFQSFVRQIDRNFIIVVVDLTDTVLSLDCVRMLSVKFCPNSLFLSFNSEI